MEQVTIQNIKIFDDCARLWVDLTDSAQLLEFSQLYLLREGLEDVEQGLIEPALPCRPALLEYCGAKSSTEQRFEGDIASGLPVAGSKEQFFCLFRDVDLMGNGFVNRFELQRAFNVLCLYDYTEKDVDLMFFQFDGNNDGHLSFAEFSKLMIHVPKLARVFAEGEVEYVAAKARQPRGLYLRQNHREAIVELLQLLSMQHSS